MVTASRVRPPYSLAQLVAYALKLGSLGFGGPVALVGYMHRDLVEGRAWFTEADYREGLTLAQLMPGPLAAQLAIYLGFVHYRVLGATLVGVAFVVPSFVMVVALGWAYRLYQGLDWMQAAFYGVGAAVIGIIAGSAFKLTRKTLGPSPLLWGIYLVVAGVTVVTQTEHVALFVAAGIIVWLVRTQPWRRPIPSRLASLTVPMTALAPAAATVGSGGLIQLLLFFAKAGAFVFGSGLAIIPFLYGGVVHEHHWLTDRQFLDAVAVAMITPGPVVITVSFIGFLVAGFPGAAVAAVGTFMPCYLFTIVPAPYFKKHGKRPGILAIVDGVTAAAIGAITGAVIVLGRRSVVDVPTAAICVATFGILWYTKRMPEPILVLIAGIIGFFVFPHVGR
ncbi:MAG TPA: chromate transporter [Candidatus Polarisedimenticolaceae bacterium]|nr:chromate transporter [Candidatus Polarisedimenticolaceae bacterium]